MSTDRVAEDGSEEPTLYDRLGGATGIEGCVRDFYERVLADDQLAGFFESVDMEEQAKQLGRYLAQAVGGPREYRGRGMRAAHRELGVGEADFGRTVEHLQAALDAANVPSKEREELIARLAPLAKEVIDPRGGGVVQSDGEEERVMESAKNDNQVARLASMVEAVPVNVMYADAETLEIEYLNAASIETLKIIEEHLPIQADQIIGTCIDTFHADPAVQRRILSNPANLPHRAVIDVGPEKLDLLVSAVHDDGGAFVGVMATWEIVTQKLETENEVARVRNMMENAPFNVMYANVETFTIDYLNPSSIKTLKGIEEHLPVRVEDLQGVSIDSFHADPAVQRRILSDPSNLPHDTVIGVGPEKLSLLVSAIHDGNGKYVGAMATWDVITERLRLEEEQRESQEREREQARELEEKVGALLETVGKAAEGDLTVEIPVRGEDPVGKVGEGFAALLAELRSSMASIGGHSETLAAASEELTAVSQQMSANAEETSAQAESVSSASDIVSQNIQTVSAGAEQMNASIREISTNATDAVKVASSAVEVAQGASETVQKLGESSTEIGKVIKVITSIAQQTNLLALNATIEAARAGEAGKGFAVVANEVKELAKETAKATEDIGRKIEAIQADTGGAVDAIAEITTVINQINETQTTIASAVEEQTATTNEIGRNVTEAAKGAAEIAETISGVATAATSTTEGASDTQRSSTELASMASELKKSIEKFTY